MASSSFSRYPVACFIFLVVVLSAPVAWLCIRIGSQPPMLSRMMMWCPGTAALLTCVLCGIDLRTLGWSWPSIRYMRWAYALPWIYALPVYIAAWAFIPGAFQWAQFSDPLARTFAIDTHPGVFALLFGIPSTMVFIVIGTMAWALGEELGWRGLLVPRLYARWGYGKTSFAVGLFWAAWHFPVLIGADYNAGTPAAYALVCFTCAVVGMSFVMTWLRMASGSLWPCVMLHAAHNTLIQAVLDAMTSRKGLAPYMTTEFGCGIAILLCASAIFIARSRQATLSLAASE